MLIPHPLLGPRDAQEFTYLGDASLLNRPDGMAEAAEQSMAKAHYLEKALCALPGVEPVYGGAYFHEFVLKMPRSQELLEALDRRGILGGLPLGDDRVLWCATEKVSRRELDEAVSIVKEVLDK